MPRKAPLVFALALVLAAIGVALYAAATAPTCSDQRQPGSYVARPRVIGPTR